MPLLKGLGSYSLNGAVEVLPTGDALVADVLADKTFSNASGIDRVGTMTNNGTYNITPGVGNVTIPKGYHSGAGVVYGDADLVSANIKNGVNINGVVGNLTGLNFLYYKGTSYMPLEGYVVEGTGSVTFKTNYIDLDSGTQSGEVCVVTTSAIDLTNYTSFKVSIRSIDSNRDFYIVASSTKQAGYGTYDKRYEASDPDADGLYSLNVTALNGSYYLRVHFRDNFSSSYNCMVNGLLLV